MSQDRFGRTISYLRISVTDRCNMRCVYCMPAEGIPWQSHKEMMRYEEIIAVTRAAAEMGVNKVRITGGEPLVRKNLSSLIQMISQIPQIKDLALTTNGLLLEELAPSLARAGLKRVNLSLDTMNPEKFARITRGGKLEKVLRGIRVAEEVFQFPLKLNIVALRGVNDDEIESLARLTYEKPWQIRFIELMPVKNQMLWGEGFPTPHNAFISTHEILDRLDALHLQPLDNSTGQGPAREYRAEGALGTIGFISPLSEHFCNQCNRMRLTADGYLRPCLLSDIEIPLLPAIRAGQPIAPILQEAIAAKPLGHELAQAHVPSSRAMRQIGG